MTSQQRQRARRATFIILNELAGKAKTPLARPSNKRLRYLENEAQDRRDAGVMHDQRGRLR
jgi:hypothetical protein